ncbi:MAG: hypothetical protein PVH88_27490 [Ignavibacteria bacterium]|jgi:hypothetical protein
MDRIPLTSVSAVWSRCVFVLNLTVQGLGCSFWRDHSDPAAYAKHYKQLKVLEGGFEMKGT